MDRSLAKTSGNGLVDDALRLFEDAAQVLFVPEAFGIDLVDRPRCRRDAPRTSRWSAMTLMPPMAASLPGALSSTCSIFSPARVSSLIWSGDSSASFCFCSGVAAASTLSANGSPSSVGQCAVQPRPGPCPRARPDFRRQQRRHQAILVGGPHRTVLAQQRCAGAFLAAETERAVEQAVGKPLEADRHFVQLATESVRHAIDQRRADHGLADRGRSRPSCCVRGTG